MFRIDLLKGSENPPRSHPLRIAGITLAFVALIAGAAWDGARFYDCHQAAATERQSAAYYDREIAQLADVAAMLDTAQKQRDRIRASLAEVDKVLPIHAKWSDVLVGLAEATPETVTIADLMAKREEQKVGQQVKYAYSLIMGVMSPSGSGPVEEFVRSLRLRMPLQPGPDSIRIISQRQEQIRGRGVPYYIIECRLKP
jgi:Tfp pilus assembly protein PilN